MSRWSFTFLMWYITILCVQPQNRFIFLYPMHIAEICVIAAFAFHAMSCGEGNHPVIRMGPATKLALLLMLPLMEPALPPAPIWSTPALMRVPPV